MPVKSWVSSAGVLLHRRTRSRPSAISASSTAVPAPITVSAIPLELWYDLPSAAETPASTAAASTPAACIACTAAASEIDSGRPLLARHPDRR